MLCFCFFSQSAAYERRISDWSSDVCSSDLPDLETGEGRYVSVFENLHGEQMILVVDRSTKSGQFAAGDMEWQIDAISADQIIPNYRFDQSELAWYEIVRASCTTGVCTYV